MDTTQQDIAQETIDQFVGAAHGDFSTVRALLEAQPEIVDKSATWVETAVEAAAQMGRSDIVQYLLDHGAPLEICTAAMLGMNSEVAGMLNEDPALIEAKGAHGLPLMWYPAITGNQPLASLLLEHGADVNAGEAANTPLHGAAGFGKAGMVAWLLEHGSNLNPHDYEGKTPLACALANKHTQAASILRERGASE